MGLIFLIQNGRENFIYPTLFNLACTVKNSTIHIVNNFQENNSSYCNSRMFEIALSSLSLNGNTVKLYFFPEEYSVAKCKAQFFETYNNIPKWWFILDDDIIFPETSLHTLYRCYRRKSNIYDIFIPSVIDVDNFREYPDYSKKYQNTEKWDTLNDEQQSKAQYYLWEKGILEYIQINSEKFAITKSIVNVHKLESLGILNDWDNYKKHVRGHDVASVWRLEKDSAVLVFGANFYHIGLTTKHLEKGEWESDPIFEDLNKGN